MRVRVTCDSAVERRGCLGFLSCPRPTQLQNVRKASNYQTTLRKHGVFCPLILLVHAHPSLAHFGTLRYIALRPCYCCCSCRVGATAAGATSILLSCCCYDTLLLLLLLLSYTTAADAATAAMSSAGVAGIAGGRTGAARVCCVLVCAGCGRYRGLVYIPAGLTVVAFTCCLRLVCLTFF